MQRLGTGVDERRTEIETADFLGAGRVADVEHDEAWRERHCERPAVRTDYRGTVEAVRRIRLECFSGRSVHARLRPLPYFFGVSRIAHIEDDEDVAALIAGISRRQIHVPPARIGIPVGAA